ncbi:uncharacterized protein TNCV_191811 [Trichonephila clavipes]|nr:uncharacterized protein TNCV_191811 [Trichonephila clavipes]
MVLRQKFDEENTQYAYSRCLHKRKGFEPLHFWIIASASSSHFCGKREVFEILESTKNTNISLASAATCAIGSIRTVYLRFGSYNVLLKDAFYSYQIRHHLICPEIRQRYRSLSWHYTFQDSDRFNSYQVIYSQFGLAVHQNDRQARRRFVEWAQNEIAVVPDFHKRILFSDEAHFWLNGYVNKQNCRIWSEANPQVYAETPLHPEKLTVWCALWAGGIIGPYFKNDEGHNVTVKCDRYRAMITNFFIPEWNNHDVQELWFQQDGATCHTARAIIDLLKDTFSDRLISRFGPVDRPPRSCDLTPLDYFLWGYVKSLVYADKPQTLDHLEDNIRRVIADIRPQMLEKVIENWTFRLDYIRVSRVSPMPEIIFKM